VYEDERYHSKDICYVIASRAIRLVSPNAYFITLFRTWKTSR